MNRNLLAVVLILVVLGVGGYVAFQSYNPTSVTPAPPPEQAVQITTTPTIDQATDSGILKTSETVVKITATGFEPKILTIKVGGKVTWINSDKVTHTVNSSPHPQHTDFPALNEVGNIKAGETDSFTFTKAGVYKYHDHLNPTLFATVTVE